MEIKANIGFINIEDIDDFNSEEIIDYEEIQRIEKEELRKKRLQERARQEEEREVIRQYQALQIALFSEYEEKKLEREDTNISLLNESKSENDISKISNTNNQNNNNNDFILSNNLIVLPSLNNKNKKINNRYNEEVKNTSSLPNKKIIISSRNYNVNTISTAKTKPKTPSKIFIQAKNSEEINKRNTNTLPKRNKSFNKYGNKNNGNDVKQQQNIKPLNLKEKLNIFARNKNVKIKLKQ